MIRYPSTSHHCNSNLTQQEVLIKLKLRVVRYIYLSEDLCQIRWYICAPLELTPKIPVSTFHLIHEYFIPEIIIAKLKQAIMYHY